MGRRVPSQDILGQAEPLRRQPRQTADIGGLVLCRAANKKKLRFL